MSERKDESKEQFDQPQSQEPSEGGVPEEGPTGSDSDSRSDSGGSGDGATDSGGNERLTQESDEEDEPGSTPGAAGEGTQSTGNPVNAG